MGTTALGVVASPGCHFCAAGIKDIEGDPQLRPVFEAHALWLVPPGPADNYADYASWDRKHPHETMTFAFDYREWPDGGNPPALRSALRSGRLLPQSSRPRDLPSFRERS